MGFGRIRRGDADVHGPFVQGPTRSVDSMRGLSRETQGDDVNQFEGAEIELSFSSG